MNMQAQAQLLIISKNHRSRIGLSAGFAVFDIQVESVGDFIQAHDTIRKTGLPTAIVIDVHYTDEVQLTHFIDMYHKGQIRFVGIGHTPDDALIARENGLDLYVQLPSMMHDMRAYTRHIAQHL